MLSDFLYFFWLLSFFLLRFFFLGFAASKVLMGETAMPRNFTLTRDFIKRPVEQFTIRKTMEIIHDALGLDPQ